MTVPPPRGFSTFLMRIGIFRRITCCHVQNGFSSLGKGACLLHGKRMDDLAAVVRQFGGLLGGDDRKEARGDNLARVRSEDPIDFLPYLQLRCTEARCQKRGCQIGVPATHLFQ